MAVAVREIEEQLLIRAGKELVRLVIIGSVDDGKSTLLGRLLYEAGALYDDQIAQVRRVTRNGDPIDFSLFTDGLKAEREQGITIDVAYRYFETDRRKFIVADTPGHAQYTRNMATGASTADAAIILLDARLGVLPQTRRHAAIAGLLGIRRLAVAVNKMDLVGFDEGVFRRHQRELERFAKPLGFAQLSFIPVSARLGDNVAEASARIQIIGHHHPAAIIRDGAGLRLKFPAFIQQERSWILPAFSPWAGGVEWPDDGASRIWLCTPGRVLLTASSCNAGSASP